MSARRGHFKTGAVFISGTKAAYDSFALTARYRALNDDLTVALHATANAARDLVDAQDWGRLKAILVSLQASVNDVVDDRHDDISVAIFQARSSL